ncbi:hypothetical protein [Allohahella sp. A8]|uniref:hypothetical protein n=1 Tax=Allohahella sp. A8 TaxID=3141461 RepID=UPI003A80F116
MVQKNKDVSQLVERLLKGGPRQRTDAYYKLSGLIVDGHDMRLILPHPEAPESEGNRRRISSLYFNSDIVHHRIPEVISAFDNREKPWTQLLALGNTILLFNWEYEQLLPTVERYLRSEDASVACSAAYAICKWSERPIPPRFNLDTLLLALQDTRSVNEAGLWVSVASYMESLLASIVVKGYHLKVASSFAEQLLAYRSSADKKLRTSAGYLLTILLVRDGSEEFFKYFFDQNAAVRDGARRALVQHAFRIQTGQTAGLFDARKMLLAYRTHSDRRVRMAVASLVVHRLVDMHLSVKDAKRSKVVRQLEKDLQSQNDEVVIEAAYVTASASIDAEDCRALAPYLAMLLTEKNDELRLRAAIALQLVVDMQGSLPIVAASATLAHVAVHTETNQEVREWLESVSERRQQCQAQTG